MKPHHIGYLVKNMAEATKAFQEIGYCILREPIQDISRGGG